MHATKIVFCLVVTVLATTMKCAADTPPAMATEEDAKVFAEVFMQSLAAGNTHDAFELAKAAMPVPGEDLDKTRDETVRQLKSLDKSYGKIIGYERVLERHAGTSLLRYDYLLRFEKSGLHWVLVFYRGKDSWVPIWMRFDERFEECFIKGQR